LPVNDDKDGVTGPYGGGVDPTLLDEVRRALAADQTIDIVTTGAKSGQRRTTEIWFTRVGGEIYITGTPAGDGTQGARRRRDWLANLTAHPDFELVLKESTSAVLPAVATVVTDPEERRRVFTAPAASYYRETTGSVDRLVDEAPLVRVTFTGEAAPLNAGE
jgi:deazaflavin-dependent oxidoreductase (nitroreductase family)